MCDEESPDYIGDIVPEENIAFRACTRPAFKSGDTVLPEAFQKYGKNHKDGLSLSLTVFDAVKPFKKNHGVIRIKVEHIHNLKRGLQVRFDTGYANHVIIRNLPCMDRGPAERQEAEQVSTLLASSARVESKDPVEIPAGIPPATHC